MTMKKYLSFAMAAMMALILMLTTAGCARTDDSTATTSPAGGSSGSTATGEGSVSQGITDDEILIGCTYATTGTWAFIGVPIVDAITSVIDRVNAEGGIRGRTVRLVHYDDEYDQAKGKTFIEKLVEEDKVFALVCLGGNIVAPSLDYLCNYGIPVVNITSGLEACYEDYAPGSAVFPVQPSGRTDGKMLLARTLHEDVFGPNKDEKLPDDAKIGVFYSTAESSLNMLSGLQEQAELEGVSDRIIAEAVTADTYSTAIQKMKNEGVDVLICLLTDSKGVTAAMDDAMWEVPYIGTYGTSTPQSYSVETYKAGRPIYATTWAEYTSPEALETLADLDNALTYNSGLDDATRESYKNNLYARAGYGAVITLVTGLQRLDESGLDLTWANFVTCMEQAPFELGAFGYYNYADGVRLGVTKLAFTEYVPDGDSGEGKMLSTRDFESLEEIMAK